MSTPLLAYLASQNENAIPPKGALPDSREWVDFANFELKGKQLCICDSWGPYDGVMIDLAPGNYEVKALCYRYAGEVRVAALRITRPGTQGERGDALGEFTLDVGAVGIADIDLIETLDDDQYQAWMEAYTDADNHPPAGRYLCDAAGTEMLYTEAGWGDGGYTVHALTQDGQNVGAEVYFIEGEEEAYPFDLDRHVPTPPMAEEIPVIDEVVAEWKRNVLSTEPIDRDACVAAFSALYIAHGLNAPKFIFCDSLMDMRDRATNMLAEAEDLEEAMGDEVGLIESRLADDAAIAKRETGIWQYARNELAFARELNRHYREAEQKAGERRPAAWDMTYGMAAATWGLMPHIVTGLASEKLGLIEPDEIFGLATKALATCGGVGAYKWVCFISDRPASIAYPGVTQDAPAGRCRIEWRDGLVCDEAVAQ